MNLSLSLPARESRAFDLVGLGEASLDLVAVSRGWPAANTKRAMEEFAMLPGGQTATALVAGARLGWRAHFAGVFGDDEFGDRVKSALAVEGVRVTAVTRPNTQSRFAIILVDSATGERTVLERRDRGLASRSGDFADELFTSGRLLLVDATDIAASSRAAQAARAAGVPTIVDVDSVSPAIDGLLEHIDIIITDASFPSAYTGAAGVSAGLREIFDRFRPALAVATLGRDGSVAWSQNREIRTPAPPVTALDTTGAGDAFRGGFAAGWLALGTGADLERLLHYANRVAALNCRAVGAQTALPGPAEAGEV